MSAPADRLFPAWSLPRAAATEIGIANPLPQRVDRAWAIDGSTGQGVKVCILDSGVEQDHPLVGAGRGRRRDRARRERRPVGRAGHRRRPLRPRHRLCRHRPRPRARLRALLGARARRRLQGLRQDAAGGPALGGRTGLRRDQHEPLDDQARLRATPCTSSPTRAYFRRTMLVASAHNMPVESYPWRFSSVDLGREPRAVRPARLLRQPGPTGRVLRARRRRRGRLARRRLDPRDREQLRHPARCPGSAALILGKHPGLTPFQLKSVLYLIADEHGGSRRVTDERLRAAVAAGVLGVGGAVPRAAPLDRRRRAGDLRRQGLVDLPPRRAHRRARVRGRRRRGRGDARREAASLVAPGIAGWVLVDAHNRSCSRTSRATRATRATSPSRPATCRRG